MVQLQNEVKRLREQLALLGNKENCSGTDVLSSKNVGAKRDGLGLEIYNENERRLEALINQLLNLEAIDKERERLLKNVEHLKKHCQANKQSILQTKMMLKFKEANIAELKETLEMYKSMQGKSQSIICIPECNRPQPLCEIITLQAKARQFLTTAEN